MVRSALVVLTLAVLAGLAALWLSQRRLIYFPSGDVPPFHTLGIRGQEFGFTAGDGLELRGWLIPTEIDEPLATVIVFNGNAGNRADRLSLADRLVAAGLDVVLFDYRGYGDNPGSPTEAGLEADARGVLAYVVSRPDLDRHRIIYLGESLGAAVATRLATIHPPFGLVLRSPFTSLAEVGRHHYWWLPSGLVWDRYDVKGLIDTIEAPVLVVAGSADTIVPTELSQAVYEAAERPKQIEIIEGADHNDPALASGAALVEAIIDFVGRIDRAAE